MTPPSGIQVRRAGDPGRNHAVTIKAGQIQFVDACLPPLFPGDTDKPDYGVTLQQGVSTASKIYTREFSFFVDAPRFSLKPTDIHSVYPPPGVSGPFETTLPHVVLTRRTLPWERTINIKPLKGQIPLPWMALLLFTQSELDQEEVKTSTIPCSDLTTKQAGLRQPAITLRPWETGEKSAEPKDSSQAPRCLVVDVPTTLFQAVVPSQADLMYLAHARQIDTSHKEITAVDDRGWFSLIIGNRLPQAQNYHRAFLVSLEGHDVLDSPTIPEPKIRLVVLASWTFQSGATNDFKGLMRTVVREIEEPAGEIEGFPKKQVRADGARLSRPYDTALLNGKQVGSAKEGGARGADNYYRVDPASYPSIPEASKVLVNVAFSQGYTALDHKPRTGETTVSWYRGPLLPRNQGDHDTDRVSSSDAALRYDPRYGLFDTSYAAAWQLGRLLALQNQSFALTLCRIRKTARAGEARSSRLQALAQKYKLDAASVDGLESKVMHALNGTTTTPIPATPPATTAPALKDVVAPAELEDATGWLARLFLLYGVPFEYLVPDEAMLPPSSIRFFVVDPVWLRYLIQGAVSIGTNGLRAVDHLIDKALGQAVQEALGFEQQEGSPSLATQVRDQVRRKVRGEEPDEQTGQGEPLRWPLKGFLLRSPVVDGWRGLEIMAYRPKAEGEEIDKARLSPEQLDLFNGNPSLVPVHPLRIEQLNREVLLGLFNGPFTRLVIRQPQESLHFGVTRQSPTSLVKVLRQLASGPDAGKSIAGRDVKLDEATYTRKPSPPGPGRLSPTGVLSIAKIADALGAELKRLNQLDSDHLTAAGFAVQMVDAAGQFTFELKLGD